MADFPRRAYDLTSKCNREECVSLFRSFKSYASGELVKHNEQDKAGMEHTLYIGSLKLEVYFCCYEKNYEQYINKIMEVEKIEKINLVGVSIGAVLVQDFANKYPSKVSSLTCIGGYDINNFDTALQKDTKQQMKMMIKALFSIKIFAEDNKKYLHIQKKHKKSFIE